jgi:hypothetical protein
MTTIVYRDGILASDSSSVTGMSITYITFQRKIQLSACKRFAWGFSGSVLDPNYLKRVEVLLLAHLMEVRNVGSDRAKFSKELFDLVDGRDFILMTKDTVYTRRNEEETMSLAQLLPGEFVGIGTGRILATAAFIAGKDAKQAVAFAMEHDYYTYASKILEIKQASLKPLPREIK